MTGKEEYGNYPFMGVRKRVKFLAWLLGIDIHWTLAIDSRGKWYSGRHIKLRDDADSMTALHEMGHALNGNSCCREHAEFQAHGFAIAMAKVLRIPPAEIEDMELRMDPYAKWSTEEACGRVERRKNKIEEDSLKFFTSFRKDLRTLKSHASDSKSKKKLENLEKTATEVIDTILDEKTK